jgi:hypothetical protein
MTTNNRGIDIITVGKRSIYNPAHYQIKKLYKSKNWLLIDLMFTWDLPKAVNELKQQRLKHYDQTFIDGVGWKNLGNDPVLDWNAITRIPYEQKENYQVTKITKGCPHSCPFCYSDDFEVVGVPSFNRNDVRLVDENLLQHPHIFDILDELRNKKVGGKVVRYEAVCGFHIELLSLPIAAALKQSRFIKPRIAWDGCLDNNSLVDLALNNLTLGGYRASDISVFMLTNYKVPYADCLAKLEHLQKWGVRINDCCYNCSSADPIPQYWTMEEIKDFRRRARKHNQLIIFKGYDPQPSIVIGDGV